MIKKALLFIILNLVTFAFSFAGELPKSKTLKTVIVSGKVIDNASDEYLAGVKINCESCKKAVYSNLDGHFFIYLEVNSNQNLTIEFSQVGYITKTVNVKDLTLGNSDISLRAQ